ncbi:MAG: haloacid dehalogenase type II [Acidimicrobiales bacterium]
MSRVEVVVFDVNETLSDLAPMGRRFADVGWPEETAKIWFAGLLRDGFALTAAGTTGRFANIAEETLRGILSDSASSVDVDAAVQHVMGGFFELPVHPDVPDGIRVLAASGAQLVTLSNGSTNVAEGLLATAGIRHHFERLLSVDDAGVWKPAPGAYAYAAKVCSAGPGAMMLVAVHPWDIDGAKRAGMTTAWINRRGHRYPTHFLAPDYSVTTVSELASCIG